MPGMSVFIIGFKLENIKYVWSSKLHCFISTLDPNDRWNELPYGAYDLMISRKDPDNEQK